MDKENEEQINAITGETNAQSETIDWKQKYEHQMEVSAADSGRMKKLAAELAQARSEIDELKSSRREEELMSGLSEDDRAGIPDDVLKVATKLVNSGMGKMQAENEKRFREMERERNAEREQSQMMAERNFVARIDSQYPKFRGSIGPGGDKADAWVSYLKYNKASVTQAYQSCDFDTLAHHIETFYRDYLGMPVPSGSDVSATSDPRESGGGSASAYSANNGKVYTTEEYLGLYDLVEKARSKGDYAEKKRLEAEIENARAEGRVKDA